MSMVTVEVGQYWRSKPETDHDGFLIESDWFRIMDISVDGEKVRMQVEIMGFLYPEVHTVSTDSLLKKMEKWEPNFFQKLLGYV